MAAHIFALFIQDYALSQDKKNIIIKDITIYNRIVSILRLKAGREVILFDETTYFSAVLREISKKNILFSVQSINSVQPVGPSLHLILPLLERDALEEVVYMATVYGAATITLITTEKSRRIFTEKDMVRLRKITISAAEQSKQFSLPVINTAVSLENFLSQRLPTYAKDEKLWCEISGQPLLKTMKAHADTLIITGPEGDFTQTEKELLHGHFVPVKLTDSTLRARDAVNLIMGVFRL